MKDRFYNFGLRHFQLSVILAIILILGVCLLNTWLFGVLFDRSYLAWYIDTGPIFGLVTTVMAMVWKGLEKEPNFISKNPYAYIGANFQLASLVIFPLAPILDTAQHSSHASNWDFIAGRFLMGVLFVATYAWLILVIPLQYFVFLFCGSVSRLSLHSTKQVVAWFGGPNPKYLNVKEQPLEKPIPEGGWVVSMTNAPFKLTAAFSTVFLFLLSQILNF